MQLGPFRAKLRVQRTSYQGYLIHATDGQRGSQNTEEEAIAEITKSCILSFDPNSKGYGEVRVHVPCVGGHQGVHEHHHPTHVEQRYESSRKSLE